MTFLKNSMSVLAHPIDFYHDLQEPDRPRVRDAIIMIALVILVRFIYLATTNIVYQQREAFEISLISEAVSIVLLWITWCIANWGISTIQDGEGKFKEILVGSAYALTPYVLLTIPIALISRVLSLQEQAVFLFLNGFLFLWVAFLVIMKVKILHDFTLYKLLFILFLTIIGMLIVWFLFIMLFGLVSQAVQFVFNLLTELRLRV